MSAAVIWLIVAFGLAGTEALTGDMFLLMLGGGALAAAGSSWLIDWPVWADGLVFLIVSVLLLSLVRPALRRRLTPGLMLVKIGIKALEGKKSGGAHQGCPRSRPGEAGRSGVDGASPQRR